MVEAQNRIRLSLLVALLLAVATVSMVVDRRALRSGGRELPTWLGPVLDVAVPVQRIVTWPVELVRRGWLRYAALLHVRDENAFLRGELFRTQEENIQLREALIAGGRLQRIAEMRAGFEVPMLPAELVGSDVSPFFRAVLLDRGREEGVRAGMPVVSEQGLVGLVVATSSSAAKVMLLLDPQTSIDGTVQRSRTRGIVRGSGDEVLRFEFVAREGDVQVGDAILTSGLGGVFSKGLLIGEVTEISEPGAQLMRTATLRPAVDFARLEQAFVLLRRGPTLELLYSHAQGDLEEDGAGSAAAGKP